MPLYFLLAIENSTYGAAQPVKFRDTGVVPISSVTPQCFRKYKWMIFLRLSYQNKTLLHMICLPQGLLQQHKIIKIKKKKYTVWTNQRKAVWETGKTTGLRENHDAISVLKLNSCMTLPRSRAVLCC